jgi:cytochrome c oxidase assembly protein subunit 16
LDPTFSVVIPRTIISKMPTFQRKKFHGSGDVSKFGVRYRALLEKRPFLAFGLPFLTVIVAGSFALTPSAAVRYERRDRKVRQMSTDEELDMGRGRRKVDMREEYYKLAAKDIDNWEQKRVKRLPGENDGLL